MAWLGWEGRRRRGGTTADGEQGARDNILEACYIAPLHSPCDPDPARLSMAARTPNSVEGGMFLRVGLTSEALNTHHPNILHSFASCL